MLLRVALAFAFSFIASWIVLAARWPTIPPIGEPRIYDGPIRVLFPGERASARLDPAQLLEALSRGETEIPVTHYLVEPMPGWRGWYLRWRYRLIGRYWSRGTPEIVATMSAREEP